MRWVLWACFLQCTSIKADAFFPACDALTGISQSASRKQGSASCMVCPWSKRLSGRSLGIRKTCEPPDSWCGGVGALCAMPVCFPLGSQQLTANASSDSGGGRNVKKWNCAPRGKLCKRVPATGTAGSWLLTGTGSVSQVTAEQTRDGLPF